MCSLLPAHPWRGRGRLGVDSGAHSPTAGCRQRGFAGVCRLGRSHALSDRIAVLYEGKIAYQTPADILTDVQLGLLMTGTSPEELKGGPTCES